MIGPREPDEDCCPCTMGHACDFHREQAARRDHEVREEMRARGINPDAPVPDELVETLLLVGTSQHLSQAQKDRIWAELLP